ncbi:hypothetical protein MRX96_053226 [Rhipicephalus microplus]
MEADPETGVVRAVQSAPPGPTGPPPKATASPHIAELIEEQKLKADKEADQMDKEMRDVELTSVELFPESRLVILLALLCILWILFLILSAAVKHGVRPGCDTTTSAGGGSHDHDHSTESPTESDETSPSGPPAGPTGSTSPTGPVGPTGSTRSTEKPLSDVYICYTEYCKKEGEYLGSLTSKSSKRACDDFYEYVCEAWKKYATPLRGNQPGAAVSTDTLLQRAMEDRLLAYIKDPTHADVTPARTMHELCTNRADADAVLLSAKELFRSWGYEWPRTASSGGTPDDVWRFAGKLLRVLGGSLDCGCRNRPGAARPGQDNHRDAVKSAVQELIPQDPAAANAAGTDVSIALAALSLLHLDDLGTSPLDFEVDSFGALGKGVQAFMGVVFEKVTSFSAGTRIMVHRGQLTGSLNYARFTRCILWVVPRPRPRSGFAFALRYRHTRHASWQLLKKVHKDVQLSLWLSQLETLFVGYVRGVSWMDNLTSLFVRYKMRHHRFERFFPAKTLDECKEVSTRGTPKAMNAFVGAYGKSLLPVGLASPLSVWARYRLCLQLIQIPVGLVNSSVPTDGTVFALHLSRFAVRLYAGLSQLLYEGTVYELEIPLYFTEEAERAFDEALDCLLCDARRRFPYGLDVDRVRNALLEQVLALQLAFMAFRNLMGVRRIWHRDFQYSTLLGVTADQLFFLYYALDHCELSDEVYESHQFEAHRRLPASVRVNMALRQFVHFADSYGCAAHTPMAAGEPCRLFR